MAEEAAGSLYAIASFHASERGTRAYLSVYERYADPEAGPLVDYSCELKMDDGPYDVAEWIRDAVAALLEHL